MAMACAALRGARCGRPVPSFYSPFRRLLGSAVLSHVPLEIMECVEDGVVISHQEHSVKVEANLPCESGFSKVKANDLRWFLEEQREIFIELQNHLKNHRVLLCVIFEELGSYKSEFKTQKELVVNAARVPSQTESVNKAGSVMCGTKAEKVQSARTAIWESTSKNRCERITKNGEPVVLAEKSTKSDASVSKQGFDADKFQHPPWPEWESFLDHLRPYASVKDGKPGDGNGELFDDTSLLKHALVRFAQTHEAAFRRLSRRDLVMLVEHEFPSMDAKTAVGKKKLRNYLVMDESEVTQAKLTDVVRLIYRAVRSLPLLDGALPDDLKSSIIHILKNLISQSITNHDNSMKGNDQKIAEEGEIERMNNTTNVVDGAAVLPLTSPSTNQDETTSMSSASLELPKFGSLKERVDARRARVAKECMEKEAAKSLLSQPLLTKESEKKTPKPCYTRMDKSKDNREVVRNFGAFDAIIESEDSDSCDLSNSQPKGVSKASLSSLVRKNWSTLSLQNKGAQHCNGDQRNNGGGKATTGRF